MLLSTSKSRLHCSSVARASATTSVRVEHGAQVLAIGAHGVAHDLLKVRAGRLDDVVVPVCLEQRAMRLEVPVVRGGWVRALQYREKIG